MKKHKDLNYYLPYASKELSDDLKEQVKTDLRYDPEKETLEDFLWKIIIAQGMILADAESRASYLKTHLESVSRNAYTPLRLIRLFIRHNLIKGKQKRFLLILASRETVEEKDLIRDLKLKNSASLRSLKKEVAKIISRETHLISIKPLKGKDGKKGYRMTLLGYPTPVD